MTPPKRGGEQCRENLKKVFGSWVVELIISGKLGPIKSGLREWHTAIVLNHWLVSLGPLEEVEPPKFFIWHHLLPACAQRPVWALAGGDGRNRT